MRLSSSKGVHRIATDAEGKRRIIRLGSRGLSTGK